MQPTHKSKTESSVALNWLFVRLFWSVVMRNGMTSIKQMAEVEMEYLYSE